MNVSLIPPAEPSQLILGNTVTSLKPDLYVSVQSHPGELVSVISSPDSRQLFESTMANQFNRDFIDRLEDISELVRNTRVLNLNINREIHRNVLQVYKYTKNYLPTISRLCLVSTFIEDGLRMYFQWNEQRSYMNESWGCGLFLASIFVLFNLFGQLGGCVMVLLQKKVPHACGVLFSIVILQVGQTRESHSHRFCVLLSVSITRFVFLQTFAYSII